METGKILTIDPMEHARNPQNISTLSVGRLGKCRVCRSQVAWLWLSRSLSSGRERLSRGWEKTDKNCTRSRECRSWVNFDHWPYWTHASVPHNNLDLLSYLFLEEDWVNTSSSHLGDPLSGSRLSRPQSSGRGRLTRCPVNRRRIGWEK